MEKRTRDRVKKVNETYEEENKKQTIKNKTFVAEQSAKTRNQTI